jgi:uncharacterized protein (TIGR03435 family)
MRLIPASVILTLSAIPALTQTAFEVASIRPSPPGTTVQDARFSFRGDRFEAKAVTVGDILDMIHGMQLYRATGGPEWIRIDRYDIIAKAGHEVAPEDQYKVIMSLLTDRFRLQSHTEKHGVPGLVLRAKRLPAGVKPAAPDEKYSVRPDGQGHFIFNGATSFALTNFLERQTHLPVTDDTGLKGTYDFTVSTVDIQPQPGEDWGDRVRQAVAALGFQVEDRNVSIELTVVDGCERPTEN